MIGASHLSALGCEGSGEPGPERVVVRDAEAELALGEAVPGEEGCGGVEVAALVEGQRGPAVTGVSWCRRGDVNFAAVRAGQDGCVHKTPGIQGSAPPPTPLRDVLSTLGVGLL
jgi:hypothetical protein